jgi:ABC-type uncharacterized transport system substrate-binding protein
MKATLTRVLAISIVAVFAASVGAENVAVVLSSDAAPYQEALDGFREVVRHRIASVQILEKNNPAGWQHQLTTLRSAIEPDLIFVIGTSALQLVSREIKNIPVVHALAFSALNDTITTNKNIYGITMIPSVGRAISLLKELNPKLRRVGTIYDPSRSGLLFSQARVAFQKDGLQLVGKETRSTGDVGAALKSLESDVEVLWLWPDERFLADDILERILLFSFERKIPVLGLSERHTEMGALLSLSYGSAKDMGRQAGEVSNSLLSDAKMVAMPLVTLRQVKLTVNLRTARRLDIEMPESIRHRADNAIKAPVYLDGDWWVFRIRIISYSGGIRESVGRVTYENGRFESEDPRLLTGGDTVGTAGFLPFATLHFTDPERKWLDFPLIPGKTWSFRYHRMRIGRIASHSWSTAEAEVSGHALETIKTPSGNLPAIRIDRTDTVDGAGYLTYFYSPKTKSVVKVTGERSTGIYSIPSQTRYELDLLDYGHRDSAASTRGAIPAPR